MKFGSVKEEQLPHINFSLPAEPAWNATILKGRPAAAAKGYVGAAIWGAPAWAGKAYPAKTAAAQYRFWYPKCFNALEFNASHYQIYPPETIALWAQHALDSDFKFCPKFPQSISHASGFQNVEGLTQDFLQSIWAFEKVLGPAFLQLSENFSPDYKDALLHYLQTLPRNASFFVELRHPAWFQNLAVFQELLENLKELNIGLLLTDAPARRDVAHMHLTVPRFMLRFVCNGLHPTSLKRTDAWVQRLKYWLDAGLEEAYIFLHPGNDAAVPELADYWVKALNQTCGWQLQSPFALQPQLF